MEFFVHFVDFWSKEENEDSWSKEENNVLLGAKCPVIYLEQQ